MEGGGGARKEASEEREEETVGEHQERLRTKQWRGDDTKSEDSRKEGGGHDRCDFWGEGEQVLEKITGNRKDSKRVTG